MGNAQLNLNTLEVGVVLNSLKARFDALKTLNRDEDRIELHDLSNVIFFVERAMKENYGQELIKPNLVKHLFQTATEHIAEMKEAIEEYEKGNTKGNEWVDPNDYVIWESFVLPALEEGLANGLYPHEMIGKGFGFLMSQIPYHVKTHPEMSKTDRSGLLRLYCQFELMDAHGYATAVAPEWFIENIPSVMAHINRVRELLIENTKAAPR